MPRSINTAAVCVAPEFTDERMSKYSSLVSSVPAGELKERLQDLLRLAEAWYALPESTGTQVKDHPSGRIAVTPLQDDIAKSLYDLIPWTRDLVSTGELFETISATAEKDLRDCAFHLLWLARELDLDREPLTLDKLKQE